MTTEAAGLGLTDVLADRLHNLGQSFVDWRGYHNEGSHDGEHWVEMPLEILADRIAEEVRTWLRAALTSPEVVEAAALANCDDHERVPCHFCVGDTTRVLAAAAETLGAK